MKVNHEAITESLGPGKRYVIWTQGCNKKCKGCINPDGWKTDGGIDRSVDQLIDSVKNASECIGVTISGGEPFIQFDELCELIYRIKAETQKDVMVYSGYKKVELEEKYGEKFEKLKVLMDIFIDGEYVESENTGSMYRGSDNQNIYFFTDKYKEYAERIYNSKSRGFSFQILDDGQAFFIGIPPVGFYEKFLEKLGGKKV